MVTGFTPAGVPAGWAVLPKRRTGGDHPAPVSRVAADPGSARRRLLIVDDEWLISMQLEQMMTTAGFEVVGTAATAADALALADRERPDLVLMDIRLHGPVDGIDAACQIMDRFGIRSLFVSAHSDAGTMTRSLAARPAGWLPKPFTEAELLQAVRSALSLP